jgi:hypothetical protein
MTPTTPSRTGFSDSLRQNPAVEELRRAAREYAAAQVSGRFTKLTDNLENVAETGNVSFIGEAAKRIGGRASPVKTRIMGTATQVKAKVGGPGGKKLRSFFGRGRAEVEAEDDEPPAAGEEPQEEESEEPEAEVAESEESEGRRTRSLKNLRLSRRARRA